MPMEHDPDFAEFEEAESKRDLLEQCVRRIDVLEDLLDIMGER